MRFLHLLLYVTLIVESAFGQRVDSIGGQLGKLNERTMVQLNKEYSRMDRAIQKKSEELISGLQKQESRLQQKLHSIDSTRASRLFAYTQTFYQNLEAKLHAPTVAGVPVSSMSSYVPKLDSIHVAMQMYQQGASLQQVASGKLQQVQALSSSLQQLQGRLQVANGIQEAVKDREQQLAGQLSGFGLGSAMQSMNKNVYYYQQQLEQYKSMLSDRDKLQDAVLRTVSAMPAYQHFLEGNSWASAIFPRPAAQDTALGATNSAAVEKEIQQKYGSQAGNPVQYMQKQVSAGQAQVDGIQAKIQGLGTLGGSTAVAMPDFTPNGQKIKTFLQRIEYGINITSQRTNYLLPTTSELAVVVGYKLSDKVTAGIGASYNVGWGTSLNHIHLSSQGIGLRSFIDIKAKGSFWLTGGFDYNYLSAFAGLNDLPHNLQLWQKSALAGVTKKVKLGKHTSSIQLLYDFLHAVNTPPTPAFVYRIGYSF